jgi:hypothetical protein
MFPISQSMIFTQITKISSVNRQLVTEEKSNLPIFGAYEQERL